MKENTRTTRHMLCTTGGAERSYIAQNLTIKIITYYIISDNFNYHLIYH